MVANTTTVTAKSVSELQAEIAALKARLAKKAHFTLKVSPKGAVSAYGMGRFPATFYAEQWETILNHGEDIRKFIAAHAGELSRKGEE